MTANALSDRSILAHYIRYVSTTAGYDKVLRTIQYSSRFCAWRLRQLPSHGRRSLHVELLAKQCSFFRKLIGIGNFIEHLIAAATVYATSTSPDRGDILPWLVIGRHLGYAIYLSSDVATYLTTLGFIRSIFALEFQREASKAWFCGLICSIFAGFYRTGRISAKTGTAQEPLNGRERVTLFAQLVSDLCDLSLATNSLGFTKYSDGFVAANGMTSSLIGVWKIWQKTA